MANLNALKCHHCDIIITSGNAPNYRMMSPDIEFTLCQKCDKLFMDGKLVMVTRKVDINDVNILGDQGNE